jgi:hypothetical protein
VASITVEPDSANIEEGQDQQFSASAEDAYGNPLSSTTFAWSLSDSSVASINSDGLASGLAAGTTVVSASAEGVTGSATMAITAAPAQEDPGTVTDLSVASVSDSTVTLTWTEVDDGTGNPAKYALRYGTPTISWGSAYPTEVSVEGNSIGSPIQYTWEGLEPGTDYEFQLVSYRGTLEVDATFGGWSDVVPATTDTSSSGDFIQKVSGDGQSATVGTSLSDPLSVRVVNASGAGVQGHTVTWTVTAGGGSVSPRSSTTDADGYAETLWTLGTSAGANAASASVDGLGSKSFSATAEAGPVDTVIVAPSSATLDVGDTLQFSAEAEDEYGNLVTGVEFGWSSAKPAVVSIDSDGVGTGSSVGETEIVVTTADEIRGTSIVLVIADQTPGANPFFDAGFENDPVGSGPSEGGGDRNFEWTNTVSARVSDAIAHSGSKSLRFYYPGVPSDEDSHAEQRFNFDGYPDTNGFWMEWWVYFPDGTESPSLGPRVKHRDPSSGSTNWKFYAAQYRYSQGPTCGIDAWDRRDGNDGNYIRWKARINGVFRSSPQDEGGTLSTNGLADEDDSPNPGDISRGEWVRFRHYSRAATGPGIEDGEYKFWINDTLTIHAPSHNLYETDTADWRYWAGGYIFGWANAGFDEDTYIYVDDFRVYDSDPGW